MDTSQAYSAPGNTNRKMPAMILGTVLVANGNGYISADTSNSKRIRGDGQLNQAAGNNKTLWQRTVMDLEEDIDPIPLARIILECNNFEDLKNLYNEQENEEYFGYIHAAICFSQAIKLFRRNGERNIISNRQFRAFISKISSYNSERFNSEELVNLANDVVKLLSHAEDKDLRKTKELTLNVLAVVIKEVNSRPNLLQRFKPKKLVNLANSVVKLLSYAENKDLKKTKELTLNVLAVLYNEVIIRTRLGYFKPRDLANLANTAAKLLSYTQNKDLKAAEGLVLEVLSAVYKEVIRRTKLQCFNPHDFASLANDAMKLLGYVQGKNLKRAEEPALNALSAVYKEVTIRCNSLRDFKSRDLANIVTDAVQLLDYAEDKALKETEELASCLLREALREVYAGRNLLKAFNPQDLASLTNSIAKLLGNIQNENLKEAKELALYMLCEVFKRVYVGCDLLKDFNLQDIASLVNSVVQFLGYAQYKNLKEAEMLAFYVLCEVLQEVLSEVRAGCRQLKAFNPQDLASLVNNTVKILSYAQNKNLEEAEILAFYVLHEVFKEVYARFSLPQDFSLQDLANLANNIVKFLGCAQDKDLQGAEVLALSVLSSVLNELLARRNPLECFNPQEFTDIASNAVQLLSYAQDKELQATKDLALSLLAAFFSEVKARENKLKHFQISLKSMLESPSIPLSIPTEIKSHFLILYRDVLYSIIKNLSHRDTIALSLVSKVFRYGVLMANQIRILEILELEKLLSDNTDWLQAVEIHQLEIKIEKLYRLLKIFEVVLGKKT